MGTDLSPTQRIDGAAQLEGPTRLSQSILWELEASRPPFETGFSNNFLARAFAHAVRDLAQRHGPCEVVELGDGEGCLAFAFLQAWRSVDGAPALRYTLTAKSEALVDFWRSHPQLTALAESGFRVAPWDPNDAEADPSSLFVDPPTTPKVVILNHAFAAARQDAFTVLDGHLLECRVALGPSGDAGLDNGVGRRPHGLRLDHDYQPVELPHYGDALLDGLLEEHLRESHPGHFLVPVRALEVLGQLVASAQGPLLILHVGRGPVRVEDGRDMPPPQLRRGGGVDLPVSFYALARQVNALGGRSFLPGTTSPDGVVAASLFGDEKDSFFEEQLVELVGPSGPAGLLALGRRFADRLGDMDFAGVLACLGLTAFDHETARPALARLQVLAEAGLTSGERQALEDAVSSIWQASLHLGDAFDLPNELAVTLLTAGLDRPAIPFFQQSLQLYGEHTATFFNLGLAHSRLGEVESALQCLARALALDPDNEGARDLSRSLGEMGEGEKSAADAGPALPAVQAAEVSTAAYTSSLEHLQGELRLLNLRLQREMERWRSTHAPGAGLEELSGQRLSHLGADFAVDGLGRTEPEDVFVHLAPRLALHRRREAAARESGVPLRLPELAERLGLDAFQRHVLVLALAPEVDERYERLFGYLENDLQRRWPTVRLALRLFAASPEASHDASWKLDGQGRLSELRLLQNAEVSSAFPGVARSRGLRLDPRTLAYLLDRPTGKTQASHDPLLAPYLELEEGTTDVALGPDVAELRDALDRHPTPWPIVQLMGPDVLLLRRVATRVVDGGVLVLNGAAVASAADPTDLVARALRESELLERPLLVEGASALASEGASSQALHRLLTSPCPQPRLLAAAESWKLPEAVRTVPLLVLHVPSPDSVLRVELWREALGELAQGLELGELAGRFQMRSAQIEAVAHRLRSHVRSHGSGDGADDSADVRSFVYAACREQCFVSLEGLAERIESPHGWDDLILPDAVKEKLRGIEHWLRYRHVVHHEWGFAERVQAGRGMAAMFTGSSGTGKTMAAGILGRVLDLDLYRIDLSSVVSKYIGETEKNLAKIFDAAQAANAILFFDEADALFGKRTQVKDSHDRHANVEVSYLLQRMESYDGIAILATNIKGNLDAAFTRRLQVVVEFPFPGTADRERIWRRLFTDRVPLAADIDFSVLAERFALSGGNIKNCALAAALAAAAAERPVGMGDLVRAVAQEYEKLGKPVSQAAFGGM